MMLLNVASLERKQIVWCYANKYFDSTGRIREGENEREKIKPNALQQGNSKNEQTPTKEIVKLLQWIYNCKKLMSNKEYNYHLVCHWKNISTLHSSTQTYEKKIRRESSINIFSMRMVFIFCNRKKESTLRWCNCSNFQVFNFLLNTTDDSYIECVGNAK